VKTKVTENNGYYVVALTGEVDLASSPAARTEILSALDRGDVFVELSEVTYMDSSGVASLVEGYQMSKDKGRRFGLVGVAEPVRLVLGLANLDKVFPLFDVLPEGP